MQINITVNGEVTSSLDQTSLPQFLQQLGLNPHLVVVEHNKEILPRQYWESTKLANGDVLEIVTIVGGG